MDIFVGLFNGVNSSLVLQEQSELWIGENEGGNGRGTVWDLIVAFASKNCV